METLKDIKLRQGGTLADVVNLPADTAVDYTYRNCAHRTAVIRIVGTDDAILLKKDNLGNDNGYFYGYDCAWIEEGFFAAQRSYGQKCGDITKICGVPFEVTLAIGPNANLVEEFKNSIDFSKVGQAELHELEVCGISRRKEAIFRSLKHEISEELAEIIKKSGQKNSGRIAEYIARAARKNRKEGK